MLYQIRLIREKKIIALVNDQMISIGDIPDNFEINPKQRLQVDSFRQKEPIINKMAVKETLENLTFPLHFIDYESYSSAVPKVDKLKPHNHFVSHPFRKRRIKSFRMVRGQNGTPAGDARENEKFHR